jgi:probable HAF family extracellular repeat protein
MSRRAVVALGALAALVVAAGSSASSSGERWVPVDFLKTVRQRYPAFVGVTPLGFDSNGRLYWTARTTRPVAAHEYEVETVQHVFVWQGGKTRDLGSLGQPDNNAWAVNARGQVAGTRSVEPFVRPVGRVRLPPSRAFLWHNGHFTWLGTLGGADSRVLAIDDRGDVVGESERHGSDSRDQHAFLWRNGKMKDLGTFGGSFSQPRAINDLGEVVGLGDTSGGESHAFLWKSGKLADLGTLGGNDSQALGIDDRGRIVAVSEGKQFPKGAFSHGFIWQDGKMTDLGVRLNPQYETGVSIGADGTVIGTTGQAEDPRGFVWRDGKVTVIGPVDGQPTDATGTGGGRVVGGTVSTTLQAHAYAWENGRTTVLPGPRMATPPVVSIDPTGTRILAVSQGIGGLRTRMTLWALRRG